MDQNQQGFTERDLVLSPMSYCWITDETKGNINCFVGPHKSNLDGKTDKPVVFDTRQKKFVNCELAQAVQMFKIAPEGWYMILKNPAEKQPKDGGNQGFEKLDIGKKIMYPGPVSFPLWPGQMQLEENNLKKDHL